MLTKQGLVDHLVKKTGLDVDLKINNNEKTMISVLDQKRKYTKLSLHKIFLMAPTHVIDALARYITRTRKIKQRGDDHALIRSFIHEGLTSLETQAVKSLETQGKVYDLQELYEQVNAKQFDNTLDLKITWFGRRQKSRGTSVTLGEYVHHLKLVKIHRLLDTTYFPPFFVRYIVFHEMLHAVYPAEKRGTGRLKIHTKAFIEAEKKYPNFDQIIQWKKTHQKSFFR